MEGREMARHKQAIGLISNYELKKYETLSRRNLFFDFPHYCNR